MGKNKAWLPLTLCVPLLKFYKFLISLSWSIFSVWTGQKEVAILITINTKFLPQQKWRVNTCYLSEALCIWNYTSLPEPFYSKEETTRNSVQGGTNYSAVGKSAQLTLKNFKNSVNYSCFTGWRWSPLWNKAILCPTKFTRNGMGKKV